ncbi:MAG: SPFH/Band 7/PHB domain protein [Kiritimatiellae bacterium]|nr:SPFH/Band 7/PHB domain protein [Kiritimatiellia bacterium]
MAISGGLIFFALAISGGLIFFAFVAVIVLVAIIKTAVVVPQKTAYIVERLGKYRTTLEAGFHILLPFFDRIAYRHTLKEMAIDVPPQECITKDNIAVSVDGILYLQVMDPVKASYGIGNYLFATTQLAQTTMRSEMGKLDLDRSFEERTAINGAIVSAVDKASDPWGIKVTRYEIKNITPPQSIRDAMEKQMRAEREKRAMIAESEGERQSKINRAEGERQQAIALSEGERERRINEAEGRAKEITLVADAQAEGIRKVAAALNEPGGLNSVNMQLAQQYLTQFGNLAKQNNTMIIPSDLANVAGVLKACTGIIKNA